MTLLHVSGLKSSKKTVGEELAFIVIVLQEFFLFLFVRCASGLFTFLPLFCLAAPGKNKRTEPDIIRQGNRNFTFCNFLP
jgi:hypothetical protein